MELTIRSYREGDEEDMATIFSKCFRPITATQLRNQLKSQADVWVGSQTLVAEVGGKIVAQAWVLYLDLHFGEGVHVKTAALAALCTSSSYRRRGIMTTLVKRAFKEGRKIGASTSSYFTEVTRAPFISRSFRAMGFTEIARVWDYVKILDYPYAFFKQANKIIRLATAGTRQLGTIVKSMVPKFAFASEVEKTDYRIAVREMRSEDAPALLAVYKKFAELRAGMTRRDLKLVRWVIGGEKDSVRLVATRGGKIVGYSLCYRYPHREAVITELVVDPKEGYEVALSLVSETERRLSWKPAVLYIRSMREPLYDRVFNALQYTGLKTEGVFMLAVIDPPKFLKDIAPILSSRLSRVRDWNGVLTLRCAKASISLAKKGSVVQLLEQSARQPDLEIDLKLQALVKLLLGATSVKEIVSTEALKVSPWGEVANMILPKLFPKNVFLILERW